MGRTVLIQGDGLAACCCARLLQADGFKTLVTKDVRPKLPTILVSQATQHLLCDIFEDRNLFHGFAPIRKRIVAWGEGTETVALPHSALVVSEQELLDRLWPHIEADAPPDSGAKWRILSSRSATPSLAEESFGSRTAQTLTIRMNDAAERDACWVESMETGWLFLLPHGVGTGTLISVGGRAEAQLDRSRLIVPQVADLQGSQSAFPAYPRILSELCGIDRPRGAWLACGSAAMGFDPLCGEGAGNAAREAILGSAAIRANARGEAWEDLCDHYSSRLLGGFLRHLSVCRSFYTTGDGGPWWDRELEMLDRGIQWVRSHSAHLGHRYRLNGFDLEPIHGYENQNIGVNRR
jgi:hypothetical protein